MQDEGNYQGSEWTGGDVQATDDGVDTGAGSHDNDIADGQFIAGQSLIDDTHNIDRQVTRTTDVASLLTTTEQFRRSFLPHFLKHYD